MDEKWVPPPYVDVRSFHETVTSLDAEPGPAGATLARPSTPTGAGAVLLTGGGPFDRDESSGPNKPLRDVAQGLAGRGIATLRFDKISYSRPELLTEPGFTMGAEYVPHALAAVDVLAREVDRVFLLGHSMGGKVAPRVAAACPAVAGIVIMAGDTQPMHHALVRAARYLADAAPETMSAAMVATFERQAAVVDSPALRADTPGSRLPFGAPASYWLDLLAYDQVATAAAFPGSILVLQGGRDYQVTVDDDLPAWRRGLADHHDTRIEVIASSNHVFFPGESPSAPAEYLVPGHVDAAVVSMIAEWIVARCGLDRGS